MPGLNLVRLHVIYRPLVAGFVILIYDHFLTIAEEIEYVWRRPKNLISWIFLCNRYLSPVVLSIDIYDKMGGAKDLTAIVSTLNFD